jgi:hypothetical protein
MKYERRISSARTAYIYNMVYKTCRHEGQSSKVKNSIIKNIRTK